MRRTILLADDSVTIRKIVELTFGETDIRVESVASGREALERFRDLRPDLVLADVVMPGPSGYEVCRAIKASDRPVPVLLLAGTFEPFDAVQARECGSDGHVTKPFDSRQLVERVEMLLTRPRAPSASVEPAPASPVDDLDSMFDDLAAPGDPEMIDRPPADAVPTTTSSETSQLTPADIDAIARRVVERLSDRVVREIAWDVVPDLADIIVRERIRELERDERESS
jgi:DNA-binding response OmpR family regulator